MRIPDPRRLDMRALAAFALRSPGRLAAVVGAAAVVAIMLAHVSTPAAVPAAPTRHPGPAVTAAGPTGTATPTIAAEPSTPTAHAPARTVSPSVSPSMVPPDVTDMAQLADQFVSTWADHTLTRGDWFAAVKPMITPRLAARLRYTKPGNVPASQVTGAATVDTGPPIVADVPTNAGTVHVVIAPTGQDYRVDRITR